MEQIKSSSELGIIIDTALCMSLYLFAGIVDDKQIDTFFVAQKERLQEQGFKDDLIDKTLHNLGLVINILKKDI